MQITARKMDPEQFIVVGGIAFLQWLVMPLCLRGIQNLVIRATGWNGVVQDTIIAIIVFSLVILTPLWALDFIPLGVYAKAYLIASLLGGVLSVPLTIWMRSRNKSGAAFH